MAKLFWKFFFFILLAQLATGLAIGGAFWLRERAHMAEHAAHAGTQELHSPPGSGPEFAPYAALPSSADGTPRPHSMHLRGGPDGRPSPLLLILVATLASLLFAALLARYFFRPIRQLRQAFAAAAAGDLQTELHPTMGNRRDALADLGQDFDRMAARLRALMEGQRRLLHHVSHELRSPIARQQIAIGLARQQPARMADLLDRIERDGQRMDQLVGDVLVLSRLESGLLNGPAEDVVLDELLCAIVDDARFEAAPDDKSIALGTDGPVVVRGHAELLHSALENVVRNALKHTLPGGTVSITVTHVPQAMNAASSVRVLVADDGPGVPADQLESIFEPFFRSPNNAESLAGNGHGLGLAIAHHVINAHGGRISASNLAQGGLAVLIELPFSAP